MNMRTVVIDGSPKALAFSDEPIRVEPMTGVAFSMTEGEELTVIDPFGMQAARLAACVVQDAMESMCGGQTIAQVNRLHLTEGDAVFSNRSNPMFTIIEDTVGQHDVLPQISPRVSPRPQDMGDHQECPCCSMLLANLKTLVIETGPTMNTLNIFSNAHSDLDSSDITIGARSSVAGDRVVLRAERSVVVALAACGVEPVCRRSAKAIDFNVRAPR